MSLTQQNPRKGEPEDLKEEIFLGKWGQHEQGTEASDVCEGERDEDHQG